MPLGAPIVLAIAVAVAAWLAQPSPAGTPRLRDAADLIFEAFDRHPVVALSDGAGHGDLNAQDFFIRLIRDPRFAAKVRNIVVEFGNARYQPVMDRYAAGGAVRRDELRRVWEDTTQVSGVWSLPMYERMLAEVRAVNATRSASQRIRVVLGDPPLDWTAVTGPADEDMNDWRDAHFAHVVAQEVMNRGERALLVVGGAHISRNVTLPNSLIHLLDTRFPGSTYAIVAVDSTRTSPRIQSLFHGARVPVAVDVGNTWVGNTDVREIGFTLSRGGTIQDDVNAILLLSGGAPRQQSIPPLDSAYARELARRRALHDATLPFRGGRIRFEENRATFTAESAEALRTVATELGRDRRSSVLVKAFADPSEADAEVLSTRRAEAVAAWLTHNGVAADRLTPRGCGARRPLTFGSTATDRAINRRAELVRLTAAAGCEPPW